MGVQQLSFDILKAYGVTFSFYDNFWKVSNVFLSMVFPKLEMKSW